MDYIKIILVDDKAIYRESLRRILVRQKDIHVIGEASNGCEYLLLAHKTPPDIVLINIRLDTSDAFDALKLTQKLFPETSSIAITFQNDLLTREALSVAGFNGVLTKDSTGKQIISTIRDVYAQRHKGND